MLNKNTCFSLSFYKLFFLFFKLNIYQYYKRNNKFFLFNKNLLKIVYIKNDFFKKFYYLYFFFFLLSNVKDIYFLHYYFNFVNSKYFFFIDYRLLTLFFLKYKELNFLKINSNLFKKKNKKIKVYFFKDFIVRLDFPILIFHEQYIEHFRSFKYNEYLACIPLLSRRFMLKFFLHKFSSFNVDLYVNLYRKSLRASFYDFYFLDVDPTFSINYGFINFKNYQLNFFHHFKIFFLFQDIKFIFFLYQFFYKNLRLFSIYLVYNFNVKSKSRYFRKKRTHNLKSLYLLTTTFSLKSYMNSITILYIVSFFDKFFFSSFFFRNYFLFDDLNFLFDPIFFSNDAIYWYRILDLIILDYLHNFFINQVRHFYSFKTNYYSSARIKYKLKNIWTFLVENFTFEFLSLLNTEVYALPIKLKSHLNIFKDSLNKIFYSIFFYKDFSSDFSTTYRNVQLDRIVFSNYQFFINHFNKLLFNYLDSFQFIFFKLMIFRFIYQFFLKLYVYYYANYLDLTFIMGSNIIDNLYIYKYANYNSYRFDLYLFLSYYYFCNYFSFYDFYYLERT